MSTRRPWLGGFLWLLLLATCSAEPTPPAAQRPASPPQPTAAPPRADEPAPALQASMQAFTRALRDADRARILRAFSTTQGWNAINTRSPVHLPTPVSHARLAQALDTPGALHDSLLGAQPGSLRSFVSGAHLADWQAHGPFQFAPAGPTPGLVWVAWRQEGEAWVIDTLAWPIN